MTTVFIAGRVTARARLSDLRARIQALGYRCDVEWLDLAQDYPVLAREAKKAALANLKELKKSDILILDTLDINPTGGREVEFGFAMGRCGTIILVGPIRNIYHTLASRHYETWEEALEFLKTFRLV